MFDDDESAAGLAPTGFALLGLNPRCGCPLALDMTASPCAVEEFGSRGLLLEYLPPSAAESAWQLATWPCHHHGSPITSTPLPAENYTPPTLRIVPRD